MEGKIYLITGANRGIGHGLFNNYVAQPNNIVIAAVRDIDAAQGLLHSPDKGENTKVILTKIDAASKTDPYDAVKHMKDQGVEHLDVVIACAGIFKGGTLEEMPIDEYEELMAVNTRALLLLYKATLPLLRRSSSDPRFAFISGASGSLTTMARWTAMPLGAFGASKALGNYLVGRMGIENGWLITLCINPGLVQTDMGNAGARAAGKEKAPRTLLESTETTSYIIDNATKQEHSEKFIDETIDRIHPW